MEECYFCSAPFESREHVPPKCFFPTKTTEDFRINLIKVPSCAKHNSSKSGDDQYMMLFFAAMSRLLSGDERFSPHVAKSVKSITRDLTWLSQLTDQLTVTDLDENAAPQPAIDWHAAENRIELKTDYPRACSFLEAVARGLLFHEEKVIWKQAVLIVPIFFGRLETDDGHSISDRLSDLIQPEFASGDNKDIFYYEVNALPGAPADYQVDMCFYKEFKATCWFFTNDKKELVQSTFKDVPFVVWSECND